MPKATTPAPVRFWAKVDKTGTCWLWTAATDRDGYGRFSAAAGEMWYSHRFAYVDAVEPIPDELTLDHLCRTRNCVRPDHLEIVPRGVNAMRGSGPAARQARQTRCRRAGHPLPPYEPGKKRFCQPCNRVWQRERKAKRRLMEATPC